MPSDNYSVCVIPLNHLMPACVKNNCACGQYATQMPSDDQLNDVIPLNYLMPACVDCLIEFMCMWNTLGKMSKSSNEDSAMSKVHCTAQSYSSIMHDDSWWTDLSHFYFFSYSRWPGPILVPNACKWQCMHSLLHHLQNVCQITLVITFQTKTWTMDSLVAVVDMVGMRHNSATSLSNYISCYKVNGV